MKYEVLEEWTDMYGARVSLIVTPRGDIEGRGCLYGRPTCDVCFGADLPLFGSTKTPRQPVATSPRRKRSRP